MDKKTAIQLLGGTPSKAAAAMGYKTRHAVYVWPDQLPQSLQDKVNGALLRLGRNPQPEPTQALANTAQAATENVASQGA